MKLHSQRRRKQSVPKPRISTLTLIRKDELLLTQFLGVSCTPPVVFLNTSKFHLIDNPKVLLDDILSCGINTPSPYFDSSIPLLGSRHRGDFASTIYHQARPLTSQHVRLFGTLKFNISGSVRSAADQFMTLHDFRWTDFRVPLSPPSQAVQPMSLCTIKFELRVECIWGIVIRHAVIEIWTCPCVAGMVTRNCIPFVIQWTKSLITIGSDSSPPGSYNRHAHGFAPPTTQT